MTRAFNPTLTALWRKPGRLRALPEFFVRLDQLKNVEPAWINRLQVKQTSALSYFLPIDCQP